MTIIAWDGTTLAADTQVITASGFKSKTNKIYEIKKDVICGWAGAQPTAIHLLNWYTNVSNDMECDFPFIESEDYGAELMIIDKSGIISIYNSGCGSIPFYPETTYFAIGSGAKFAMATMHLGYDSMKAIEVANNFDPFCGSEITTLTF